MASRHTKFLATAAIGGLMVASPMALQAQVNESETNTAQSEERRLTCQAEVRALAETVRSEPSYEALSAEFENILARADGAAVRAEEGLCYVRLLEAQQFLADSGMVLEGYTDRVAIYETLAAAQEAGAMTSEEVEAVKATVVEVEARPARVAVTPEAAQVKIEREATQVAVQQQGSEITVEQPQSKVAVQQAQPEIDVTQPEPEVDVQASAPEVEVVQPEPEIAVKQAQPEVDVTQSKPQVTIEQPQPEVTIKQHKPEVEITQPAPDISVKQPEPEVAVVQPEPKVTVESAEPVVTVSQAEPEVDVAYAEPEVDVTQREPEVTVEAQQPQVTVSETEPQVAVSQAEPQVNVSQAEPQVDVSQERAQVTTEMDRAEVAISAEQGVDVQASREQGVDVAVEMEKEGKITIGGLAIAETDVIKLEEIEFPFDSDTLRNEARKNVRDAVTALEDGHTAILVGYASPIGDEAYNHALSERRVESVRSLMLEMGANPDQIIATAEGENESENEVVEDGSVPRTEENRRVEIRIVPNAALSG